MDLEEFNDRRKRFYSFSSLEWEEEIIYITINLVKQNQFG